MNEKFLHYIWKLQYFDKKELNTVSGEPVVILHPGILNTDAGPDFLNAKVKIGDITWFGNIEIHIRSSDWKLHQHADDTAYNNVILHVVYSDDQPARRDNGSILPVVELKNRISESLIRKYKTIDDSTEEIPCGKHLKGVDAIHKLTMIERALMERLETKSLLIKELLKKNTNDWQETTYQLLARNFGFKINSDPFLKLAQRVPLKYLLQQRDSLFKLEAILFGQAGLLDDSCQDQYPKELKKEYEFQGRKLKLEYKKMETCEWKFLRVRPANFPTIRIAEYASLIYQCPEFLTDFFEIKSFDQVKESLKKIQVSAYWKEHYVFDIVSDKKKSLGLGEESFRNILINTIVPLLFTYGKLHDNEEMVDKAVFFLNNTSAEDNRILRLWAKSDMNPKNAFDAQGLLEMYHSYCAKKNCLKCEIGSKIMVSEMMQAV